MRVAALSDLHIGSRDRTCGFRHRPADFLRWLDRLEARHDAVVLLGDIWQTDHAARTGAAVARRELDRARGRSAWLVRRAEDRGYHLVHGNHDAITGPALGAATSLRLGPADGGVLLTHGDAHDPVIAAAPRASATGTWFTGRLRAAGLRGPAEWFEEQDVQVKHRRFRGPTGPYARAAADLARRHAARVVVMGHTHVPTLEPLDGAVFANTGTCSRRRFMGVSVDLGAGTVSLLGPGARPTATLDLRG